MDAICTRNLIIVETNKEKLNTKYVQEQKQDLSIQWIYIFGWIIRFVGKLLFQDRGNFCLGAILRKRYIKGNLDKYYNKSYQSFKG